LLVLTRHVHQSIVIGHDVIVTVLEVRGDQVRLGITAPKDIQVHREEVFAALTAANRQAATSASELEVLKELSSEPVASSQVPGQRPGPGGGPPVPRRGPGLAPPAPPESGPGPRSATGPGSRPQSAGGPGPGAPAPDQPAGPPAAGSPTASRSAAGAGAAPQQPRSK
jgi:carbon storage regulator